MANNLTLVQQLISYSPRMPVLLTQSPQHDTKADVVVLPIGRIAAAVRRAALFGSGVPRAAAQHAPFPFLGSFRVLLGTVLVVVAVVPVLAPFPDVAVHVVQAPFVGGKAADLHRL